MARTTASLLFAFFVFQLGAINVQGWITTRLQSAGIPSRSSRRHLSWLRPLSPLPTTTPFATSIDDDKVDLQKSQQQNTGADDELDENEFEYVEYDALTEEEFVGSEWMIGTNWDNRPNDIAETWVRLIVDKNGKNVAIWGDDENTQGKWSLDVASQFLSISKENVLWGKKIWACTVDDFYYLQGTVRGWNFLSAACVLGQFQAKRLGVDANEAGTAPWFQQENTEENEEQSEAE